MASSWGIWGASRSIWKHMETSGEPLEASVKHLEASGRHLGCWTVPRRKPPESRRRGAGGLDTAWSEMWTLDSGRELR